MIGLGLQMLLQEGFDADGIECIQAPDLAGTRYRMPCQVVHQ